MLFENFGVSIVVDCPVAHKGKKALRFLHGVIIIHHPFDKGNENRFLRKACEKILKKAVCLWSLANLMAKFYRTCVRILSIF